MLRSESIDNGYRMTQCSEEFWQQYNEAGAVNAKLNIEQLL